MNHPLSTTSKILIVCAVIGVLIAIAFVIGTRKPKDNYDANGTTATPISSMSYLVSDPAGNLSLNSGNGYFDNLNANQSLSVSGNPGNAGDLLVSGGGSAPPMWTSGAMRYIASGSYTIPSGTTLSISSSANIPISTSDPSGSKTSLTLSNLNPGKTLLIFLSLHNLRRTQDGSGGSFNIIPTLTSTGGSQTGTPLNGYMPVLPIADTTPGGLQIPYSFISDSLKTGAGGNQTLSFATDTNNFDSFELWGPSTQSVVVFELQ